MPWPIRGAVAAQLSETIAAINFAINVLPDFERQIIDVNEETDFDNEIPRVRGRKYLYFFELTAGAPDEVYGEFLENKRVRGNRLPRDPKLVRPANSQIMYVGSSVTGVCNRLRQHVGQLPQGTYALKLATWFNHDDWSCDVHIRGFDRISRPSLQFLEDATALCLEPLFGKRGGNGR